MTDTGLPKSLFIFIICVPLAIFIGYLLGNPLSFNTFALVGLCLVLLILPILLNWHHALTIIFWNASMIVFFLPGQPSLGVVMACASLGLAMLHRTMSKSFHFVWVPQLSYSLIFLALVVLVTMELRGGLGGRVLGTESWGAKRYVGVIGAIIGYFALTSQRVPPGRGLFYAYIFILSGATAIASDLAYAGGPNLYFLFAIFPAEMASAQAYSSASLFRLTGVAWGAMAIYYYLLLRFGLKGLMDISKPWRLLSFLSVLALSLAGGYRSTVIMMILIVLVQFYFEGLFRSRYLPILALAGMLSAVFLVGFVDRLPLAVQRSFSFLPLNVDVVARHDAASTLDWRLQIWKIVLPEVPKYLFLGKGYGFSGTDYNLTQEAIRRGLYFAYEDTLISGNYHNGILTLLIPFGIFGLLAFMYFCWSSLRLLYQNYWYGDPQLKLANTFMLSFFATRLLFFLVFYGQFELDMMVFTGTVGFSISLNGGVCSKPVVVQNVLARR